MKLLVDMSSLLWQSLLADKDKEYGREVDHDGKKVWVNGWQYGLECALNHLGMVMRELKIDIGNVILVVEGEKSKAQRKAIYAGYKEERDSRAPEAYVEFGKCKEVLVEKYRAVGATVVTQIGVEADDILAYLARKLEGEIVILTRDGDMTTLINDRVSLWQGGMLTKANKYGPFEHKYVPVYKALCGDGNEYKGAKGFGPKAFLDLLVWGGDGALPAIEGMMQRRTLHELEDDVAEFKPMRKIIDSAEHVYQSYACALLHDEWVDTARQPLVVQGAELDALLHPFVPPIPTNERQKCVFDVELIGSWNPKFLLCVHVLATGERASFWWHKDGDMARLKQWLARTDLTWVSFNGIHFDAPIISAAVDGKNPLVLKEIANYLVNEEGRHWHCATMFCYTPTEFDHIDLWDVAPGVQISLKIFAGRMGYPTMVDMPFHHDHDLTAEEEVVVEAYCQNDLGVTAELLNRLKTEVELREEMSLEYGIDLRSKSDAQAAEAILKKVANITKRSETPKFVEYKAPPFIETDSDDINDLILRMNETQFKIHPVNGQVVSPDYLIDPMRLCSGTYQVGVGGLHSTHDKRVYMEASDEWLLSDFDVAGYYPNVMLKAGLTPRCDGGDRFIAEYRNIYDRRIAAKRNGNKKVANALKIALNGTFGKLGSPYSAFYSPDLMLAVTLTGQLNLMCLIYDLECRPSIQVRSANTDGILVAYRPQDREKVLSVIAANAKRTGFEYEETRYSKVAMKDVNNYIAITSNDVPVIISPSGEITEEKAGGGKAKRKGLYASINPKTNPLYLMKNPTMGVCSDMAVDYLKSGIMPAEAIANYTDIKDFVAIRNIKGGGIQYDRFDEVDDWVCVLDLGTKDNQWRRPDWDDGRVVMRKSRPKPVQVGVGGESFGRVARWYQQAGSAMTINYLSNGNKVPKTEGAKLCMTLPATLPDDLDREWYVNETLSILNDLGVPGVVPAVCKQEEMEEA